MNNQAGLGTADLLSIQSRINQIFGATATPNGDTTAVNFVSGTGDYNLQLSPASPLGTVGRTGGGGPFYWGAATVYIGTAQAVYGPSFLIGSGTAGAHELTHRVGHIGDLPYNGVPNLMNADSAVRQGVSTYADDINPNVQGFAKLTPAQAENVYNQCQKKHPPTKAGAGGGGGGNGGGVVGLPGWYTGINQFLWWVDSVGVEVVTHNIIY